MAKLTLQQTLDKSLKTAKQYVDTELAKKADASHGTHVTWSTTTPKANGTATVGSETKVARGDHVHPLQTTISGNAGSATKLQTARTLTVGNTGKTFNGSANVSWSLSEIGALPLTGGTISGGDLTVKTAAGTNALIVQRSNSGEQTRMYQDDATFYVNMTNDETGANMKFIMSATDTENGDGTGGFSNSTVTFSGSKNGSTVVATNFNGNASTTTKLQTARNIALSGHVTGSANFDGSGNITIATTDNTITTITKSLKVTTAWMDTGIRGSNLSTGTYAVQLYVNGSGQGGQWTEYYSGIMSWYNGTTSSADSDEIFLHKAGHATNGKSMYLRTIRESDGGYVRLQIAADAAFTAAVSLVFKFKKLI